MRSRNSHRKRACRRAISAWWPLRTSSSPAYARVESSSQNRVTLGPCIELTSDFSTSRASASAMRTASTSGESATACAASSVKAPANTDRLINVVRSLCPSRSTLQASAAPNVRCRGSAVRRPCHAKANRLLSKPAVVSSPRAATRPAASSSANGMPSSLREIAAMVVALVSRSSNCGEAARARATNNSTALNVSACAAVMVAESVGASSDGKG